MIETFKKTGSRAERNGVHRILFFRALNLGDMLCAVPMLRALRSGLPEAELTLLGLPWAEQLVTRFPNYIDGFRPFPGYPGLPEVTPQIARIPRFLQEIQAEKFDLAIQAHGSGSFVNPLTALFGAKHCAGFYIPGEYCPDAERFLAWPKRGLEIRRLLALATHLGMPARGEFLEFPVQTGDYQRLAEIGETAQLEPGRFVCLHPGASVPARRWPLECFAEVARWAHARGLPVVLTGTANETPLTRLLQDLLPGAAIDLAGRTDLGTLAALLQRARMVICNDTGVSHLADALQVPSVVISTGDNPDRWAPVDRVLHRTLANPEGVPVDAVIQQAEDLFRFGLARRERGAGDEAGREQFAASALS